MPRRRQFNGICHDILDSFISRYNDISGYWALGQFVTFLSENKQSELIFLLPASTTAPESPKFQATSAYYHTAILRLMHNNAMPRHWLADTRIRLTINGKSARCDIEIIADTGRTYHREVILTVRPHDPSRETRRLDGFGPSNQRGV